MKKLLISNEISSFGICSHEKSLELQGFEDFSFSCNWRLQRLGFAVFCGNFGLFHAAVAKVLQIFEPAIHWATMGSGFCIKRSLEMPISFQRSAAISGCDLIHKLFWCNACLFCLVFDFLSMFIRSGYEQHVVALEALIPGHGICGDGAVGVSDMKFI